MNSSKIQKYLNREIEDEQNTVKNQVCILAKMPPEVLEMIFKQLTYDDIAKTVRLVSKQFQTIATSILNNAFLTANTRLKVVEKQLEQEINAATDEVQMFNCHKSLHIMEVIKIQYQMLKAVTWRYTHPVQQHKFFRLCFYAGYVLDLLFRMLYLLETQANTCNALHDPQYIADFVAVCKRFMNHFEEVSERRVNKSPIVSGCKMIDILDCFMKGRTLESFRISSNHGTKVGMVCMKVKYVIKRAWFTCLEVDNTANENSWKDEQRFMYLRLRRLIGCVNMYLYETEHFNTELKFLTPLVPFPKPPSSSTYSGFGEYGGRFFHYGHMNKVAFENRFRDINNSDWTDSDSEEDNSACTKGSKSSLDLIITADIRCTAELAPLAVRSLIQSDDPEIMVPSKDKKLEMYLKLHVICPVSEKCRLPGSFTWEVTTSHKGRH